MPGGTIYVGGKVELARHRRHADRPRRPTRRTTSSRFLDRYEIPFTGKLQKVVNAGKNLRYPRTEPRVRVIPFFVASERTDYWNAKVQEDIAVKAQIGRYRIRGYGAGRPLPHISTTSRSSATSRACAPDPDVVSQGRPRDADRRPLRRQADRALDARDDRADELRRALEVDQDRARQGLARSPTSRENSGEGGLIHEQVREAAKRVVVPVPRRPARLEHPRHAARRRARDLHLAGREARPRRPADGEEGDRGHRAPARHPGRHRPALALAPSRRARRRRPRDQGRGVPRGDRLARSRSRSSSAPAASATTSRSPTRTASTSSASTACRARPAPPATRCSSTSASRRCRRSWRRSTRSPRSRRPEMPIVLMGGIKDGIDAAKAIALGAHARRRRHRARSSPAAASPACSAHVGQCVVGIATQDPEYEKRYDIDGRGAGTSTATSRRVRWQLASVVHAHGYASRLRALARRPRRADARGGGDHAAALCARSTRERRARAAAVGADERSTASPRRPSRTSTASSASRRRLCRRSSRRGRRRTTSTSCRRRARSPARSAPTRRPTSPTSGRGRSRRPSRRSPRRTRSARSAAASATRPASRPAGAPTRDGPLAIRNLKRYVMDKLGATYRLPPVPVHARPRRSASSAAARPG